MYLFRWWQGLLIVGGGGDDAILAGHKARLLDLSRHASQLRLSVGAAEAVRAVMQAGPTTGKAVSSRLILTTGLHRNLNRSSSGSNAGGSRSGARGHAGCMTEKVIECNRTCTWTQMHQDLCSDVRGQAGSGAFSIGGHNSCYVRHFAETVLEVGDTLYDLEALRPNCAGQPAPLEADW